MAKRLPDARTTVENVKRGVLDESYLAVSPFDIDEGQVRRQMKRRATTNGKSATGRHATSIMPSHTPMASMCRRSINGVPKSASTNHNTDDASHA